MFRKIFFKKIRNFFGIFPSYFLIDFNKKNYSISDGFFWRTDNNFITTFNFSDLLNIFYLIRDSNAEIIFFNKYGEMLKKLKFENLDFIHSLVIDKKFMNDIEDYGTFYIFHNTNSKFNSILRNSCYTGYSVNKNLPSFVHGNLSTASKNLNNNKINFDITGKSFLKKNTYFVQNYLDAQKTEILLLNPTRKNLDINVNDKKYSLKNGGSKLINIDKKFIKIVSNCYLIRPIVFSYENEFLDVYHG